MCAKNLIVANISPHESDIACGSIIYNKESLIVKTTNTTSKPFYQRKITK
jgi:hypothetical protein